MKLLEKENMAVINSFTDDELIDELDRRGVHNFNLSKEECEILQALIEKENGRVGSILWSIREKLVIR